MRPQNALEGSCPHHLGMMTMIFCNDDVDDDVDSDGDVLTKMMTC